MNLSNPLPPIRLAYEAAQESFRVAVGWVERCETHHNELFEQKRSLILNSSGRRNVFDSNNNWRVHS
jgi:hypothetical protein